MVEYSWEYTVNNAVDEEMDAVLDDLEQRMANHGYTVHQLAEEAYKQSEDMDEDVPYPPEVWTDDYGAQIPHLYIADDDATQEDVLHDGAFAAAVDLIYTHVATRDDALEDDLFEWAEAWEDVIDLDAVDDPVVADRTIDRGTVVLYPGDAIEDPM